MLKRINYLVLILTTSFVSISLAAKKKPEPKLLFSVLVDGKYSNQKTTIYREGKDWICSTELKKIFFAGEKKFDMKLFNQAMAEKPMVEKGIECRESMTLIDHNTNKKKTFQCDASEKIKKFLNKLANYCGR
ncbi:MAG: hypothetical protein AABZ31_13775 [Bdellovibrionota bacterium]